MEKIYQTIDFTNSLSAKHAGKIFQFSFTKKQYYRYLLSRISWVRVIKTILIVTGIIGLFFLKPLFIACGFACIATDLYSLVIKKMNWYFIFVYPLGYFVVNSWFGIIYVSFVLGILNLLLRGSFYKMPSEIDIDKIVSQNLIVK